jgi:hypothetical protein
MPLFGQHTPEPSTAVFTARVAGSLIRITSPRTRWLRHVDARSTQD